MKKLALFTSLVLILFLLFIYFIIPSRITISRVIPVKSTDVVIYDYLLTNKNRLKWWPEHENINKRDSSLFIYHSNKYIFKNAGFNSAEVTILDSDFKGIITSKFIDKKNIQLVFELYSHSSLEPTQRFKNYLEANILKKEVNSILNSFVTFIQESKNVYGFEIKRGTVKDTILITSTYSFNHYPAQTEISPLIKQLKTYAESKGARLTNYPMLNITKIDKTQYISTIAIPIDSFIPSDSTYKVNRMVPGNILFTEVKGGRANINHAFEQLKKYMIDFKLISPAMPFESMITNRSQISDSSQWITKIYYPIF
ncbi:MAG: hypothetical protein IE931_01250 [Sphingobacteriales bacterium]|nr:hypothetical protein [Sphingobacteriales bacterium]